MNMMYISLKICGNPESNGGFQPILLFNNPMIEIPDKFDSGFEANSYYFSLKTEPTQVIYKLIKNNVRSYGSIRAGSLVIAVSIPKGYRIDGGQTPFDALTTIKDAFLQRCMTCRDPLKETYEFNPGRIESTVLDDVAQRFALVPAVTPWHPMTEGAPVGCIIRPEADILQLFRDVQYPEFERFSELLVAEQTSSTNYVPVNVAIPRVPQYRIYVNSQLVETVSDITRRNSYRIQETAYAESVQIAFTMEQLLNGDSFPEIQFDRVSETVQVTLKALGKEVRYMLSPNKLSATLNAPLSTLYQVRFRGRTKQLDANGSFTLIGDENANLKNEDFEVKYLGNDMEVRGWGLREGQLQVMMENIRETPSLSRGGGQAVKPAVFRTIAVDLLLPIGFEFTQSMSKHALKVKMTKDGKEVMSWHTVFTKANTSNRRYHGEVLIPKSWGHQSVNFVTTYDNYDFDSGTIVVPHPADNITVELQVMKKGFMDRFIIPNMRLMMLVIGLLLGLLLGCIVGYVSHDTFKKLFNSTTQKVTTERQLAIDDAPAVNKEELQGKITGFYEVLKQEDLKFTQIDDIYSYYMENAAMMKEIDPDFCLRIEDYKKVSDALRNNAFESIRKEVDEDKLKIDQKHRMKMFNYFIGAVKNGKTERYGNVERGKRIIQFDNDYTTLTSFADLNYVPDAEEPAPPTSNTQNPAPRAQPQPGQRTAPNPTTPVSTNPDDRD